MVTDNAGGWWARVSTSPAARALPWRLVSTDAAVLGGWAQWSTQVLRAFPHLSQPGMLWCHFLSSSRMSWCVQITHCMPLHSVMQTWHNQCCIHIHRWMYNWWPHITGEANQSFEYDASCHAFITKSYCYVGHSFSAVTLVGWCLEC